MHRLWLLSAAVVLFFNGASLGTQHLVRAGEAWENLGPRLKPGDEILLLSGRHKPAVLDNVRGTIERPIIIRSLDPKNPAIIAAKRYGIRLFGVDHVRLSDITITGATIHGLSLEGPPAVSPSDPDARPAPMTGHVRISGITVNDTGPRGLRHAISIKWLANVEIDGCRVNGWAGSGIEIIGCEDVKITECHLEGSPDHQEMSGIRVRAASRQVQIKACTFVDTGDQGVCVGGNSKPGDLREGLSPTAEPGSAFEAFRVRISRCIFRGGQCAVAYVNSVETMTRHCTIVRPRRAVLSIRHEQQDPRFSGNDRCTFGSNLITWQPGDVTAFAHVGQGADASGLNLEQNLWWSSDLAAVMGALGTFPGTIQFPQVTDLDPALDENLRPTVVAAELFGDGAP